MTKTAAFQIYNASAGSGKTFTLVKKYLLILLKSNNLFKFQNILAITFTNKASAEMKERILNNLQEFSEGITNDMFQIISKETGFTKDEIQQKSKKRLHAILNNYSAFNITTIDSFTYKIVKTFARDLKIPMNFEVELDAVKLLNESIDVLITKIGVDPEITKILIDFSIQKSNEDKSWDIAFELQKFSKILLNENDALQIKKLSQKTTNDFLRLKQRLQKKVNQIEAQYKSIGENALQLINDQDLQNTDFYRTMLPNHFKNLYQDSSKVKFFDQSKLRERIEENVFYSKSKPNHIKEKIEAILPQLLDMYLASEKLFQQLIIYKTAIESVIPLAVLNYIQKTLDDLKDENNIRLNAEFNQLIFNSIKDEPVPFIYERLGEKFQHYFIDEMQDTSVMQWQNLQKLIGNSLESQNLNEEVGSLLLVGDAKQSIYRWRGGNPEQFIGLATTENPFQVQKSPKNLTTNYRSYSEIVHFNNRFFEHISNILNNEAYKSMYANTVFQEENNKKGGFVQLSFLEKTTDVEEKETLFPKKVMEIIEQIDPAFKRSDICILVRKKADGIAVANYLSEKKAMSVISSETLLLNMNPKVQFIIHLLTYINDSSNDESKIHILLFLHKRFKIKEDLHAFLSTYKNFKNTSFFENLKAHHIYFQKKEFLKLSLYEAIEYCMRSFGLVEEPDEYMHFFLDLVLEFQQKKQTLNEFLTYWDEKGNTQSIVVPEIENAVRIMTIHKAKGLEFPIVIYPYNTEIYREVKPLTWYETKEDPVFKDFDTFLLNYKAELKYAGTYAENLVDTRREKLELDNFNLLYVALTRAVEQLYIITHKKELNERKISTFADLFIHFLSAQKGAQQWQDSKMDYSFGNSKKQESKKNKSSTIQTIPLQKFISSNWKNHQINLVTNESLLWDTTQGEAIAKGNLLHKILSEIYTENDIEVVLKAYVFEGKVSNTQLETLRKQISSVVQHNELKQYFDQNCTIWNEREIVTNNGAINIPDRLVLTSERQLTIIDYKTGAPEKKHHLQIQNYGQILAQMNFVVVKKLLIYINEEILIEEVV